MPIDNQFCQEVTNVVNSLREEFPRQIVTIEGKQVRENLENYFTRVLKPELRRCFPCTNDIVLGAIGLMAYLVPESTVPPPEVLRDELINHADKYASALSEPEMSNMLVQLAIAYGCGWQREAMSSIEEWDAYWPDAIMTDTTYNFVVQTMGILKKTVRDFKRLSNLDRYELREFAELICIEFIGYKPKPNDPKYMQYQTIHNWEPQKGNLYGWLQRAINGGSIENGHLPANFFRNGLLFPLLKQEGRLDVGNVAFQECDKSDCDYQAEYNGEARCSHDGCDGGIRIIRKTILIVPEMVYSPLSFWRCSHCEYYYEYEKEECPYCGHRSPQRPATLLVYPQDVQYDKEGDEYNETPKQLTINRISRQQFTVNGISRFSLAT